MRALIFGLVLVSQLVSATPDPERVKQVLSTAAQCDNFVRLDDDNVYIGMGPYMTSIGSPHRATPATVTVLPLKPDARNYILNTSDSAIDSVRVGTSLYVLTYSAIEEWNLPTKTRVGTYPTTTHPEPLAYKQHPEAFALAGDRLIIAHGRLGLSIFSLKSKSLVREIPILQDQLPLESMATGITVQGQTAFLTVDDFTITPDTFRGILVFDLASQTVIGTLGGLDPGADSITSDAHSLIVSYDGNPIWRYLLGEISSSLHNLPAPHIQFPKFPKRGVPMGHASLDDKYYYTCFAQAPAKKGELYTNVPLALDRVQVSH